MIIDKRNERLYWKKYFDDERRLRVEQKQKRQKQNTFIRKSDNHQKVC